MENKYIMREVKDNFIYIEETKKRGGFTVTHKVPLVEGSNSPTNESIMKKIIMNHAPKS